MEGSREERKEETKGKKLTKRVLTTSPNSSIDSLLSIDSELANVMYTHLD